jgi:hypothetical protein
VDLEQGSIKGGFEVMWALGDYIKDSSNQNLFFFIFPLAHKMSSSSLSHDSFNSDWRSSSGDEKCCWMN